MKIFKNINYKILKFCLICTIILFLSNQAVADSGMPEFKNPFENLQIKIPGLEKLVAEHPATCGPNKDGKQICQFPWIGVYIASIYKYAIGIVGILAAVVLMIGGVIWLTAGGNTGQITEAKAWIGASLTGLVIALSSYLILYQINPNLIQFKPLKITRIGEKKVVQSIDYKYCEQKTVLDGDCSKLNQFNAQWINGDESECNNFSDNLISDTSGFIGTKGDESSETTANQVNKCCCTAWDKIWKYDPNIKQQTKDASNELKQLLICMRHNLPNYSIGRISSISDESGFDKCKNNYSKPPCYHSKDSCHYGGGVYDKSLAVDFGDEGNAVAIMNAAEKCGAGFKQNEGNHVHISIKECPKN